MPNFENYLCISHKPKAIPYGGSGIVRADGDANFGFKCLKGALHRADEVPELQRDSTMKQLAVAINGPATGLLSIGCVSGPLHEDGRHRYMGYFEFAFNSRTGISDAQHYFPAFFHFDRRLTETPNVRPVMYHWELQPCTFVERDNASGYSCAITVNTHWVDSHETALQDWEQSLGYLRQMLEQIPPFGPDALY
ncbi:hypothetical protein PI87_02760 [Ralstonia sp. A12]|uniref:hypothetical protein n=1 Tax=Ralstonia sp. A12 TaxID=1217052 RepID=UPI000575D18A|nr:hypothetical protein [Ralstonia sp. A12]KHK58679.1 hypothetical protein PI87_02760 [Ralstonia sp. A12]